MTTIPVGRVYDSILQEGAYSGTPVTIVKILRTQDPPAEVGHYTSQEDFPVVLDQKKEISLSVMLKSVPSGGQFARIGEATLYTILKTRRSGHVILNGADPLEYNLDRLMVLLAETGKKLQIETSGLYDRDLPDNVWLTLRLPPVREGSLVISNTSLERADEILAKIHRPADVERLCDLLSNRTRRPKVWLIPGISEPWLLQTCVEAAVARRWRVYLPRKAPALA